MSRFLIGRIWGIAKNGTDRGMYIESEFLSPAPLSLKATPCIIINPDSAWLGLSDGP